MAASSPSPTKRESFGIGKDEPGLTAEELQRIQDLENVQLRTSPDEEETLGGQEEEAEGRLGERAPRSMWEAYRGAY